MNQSENESIWYIQKYQPKGIFIYLYILYFYIFYIDEKELIVRYDLEGKPMDEPDIEYKPSKNDKEIEVMDMEYEKVLEDQLIKDLKDIKENKMEEEKHKQKFARLPGVKYNVDDKSESESEVEEILNSIYLYIYIFILYIFK